MILFPLMMYGAKLYGAVMLISETSVQAYIVFYFFKKNIWLILIYIDGFKINIVIMFI